MTSQHEDWACQVDVIRGTQVTVLEGHGVDSLKALISAIAALRHGLKQTAPALVWLGEPGAIGIPLVVQDDDPHFILLVEHLLEAEYSRQLLSRNHRDRNKDGS